MNKCKITLFINKLSEDTLKNIISCNRITNYENLQPSSNTAIFYMLFQNEYRRIDYPSSFYAFVGNGAVFVINEYSESGRDGSIISGYKIYLQDDFKNKVFPLSCPSSLIHQLLNSILSYLSVQEADAESFIDNYLAKPSS